MSLTVKLFKAALAPVLGTASKTYIDAKQIQKAKELARLDTAHERDKLQIQERITALDMEIKEARDEREHYRALHGPTWTRLPMQAIEWLTVFAYAVMLLRDTYGYADAPAYSDRVWLILTVVIGGMFGSRALKTSIAQLRKK